MEQITPQWLVENYLPNYKERYEKWDREFREFNGDIYAGEPNNAALKLKFAMINFEEALKEYGKRCIINFQNNLKIKDIPLKTYLDLKCEIEVKRHKNKMDDELMRVLGDNIFKSSLL